MLSSAQSTPATLSLAPPLKYSPLVRAQMHLLLGQWSEESGDKQSGHVIDHFRCKRIHDCRESEETYFGLGHYFDAMMQSQSQRMAQSQTASSASAADDMKHALYNRFLPTVLIHYLQSLKYGHRYLFQTLPRMLTLIFDHAEFYEQQTHKNTKNTAPTVSTRTGNRASQSGNGSANSRDGKDDLTALHEKVVVFYNRIPNELNAHQLLTALPQIISRLCHPDDEIVVFITRVITAIFRHYPQHCMWGMAAVLKSVDKDRKQRGKKIIDQVIADIASAKPFVRHFTDLIDELIRVCAYSIKDHKQTALGQSRVDQLSVARSFPNLAAMAKSTVIIPIQSALTVILPPSPEIDVMNLASLSNEYNNGRQANNQPTNSYAALMKGYRAFPSDQTTIAGFDDTIAVLHTKEKPRKLTMLGSDGKKYTFLCKKEVRGDVRKNSRMVELNTVINRLLRKAPATRRRQLRLRTFSVLPLTEDSGLIEWVNYTRTYRDIVRKCQERANIYTSVTEYKKLYEQVDADPQTKKERDANRETKDPRHATKAEMALYVRLCTQMPPKFHEWFLINFSSPNRWFHARQLYAHSTAVWSMVGYLVGLGDRHGENILLDESNGECIHVDFDCLFGRGLKLDTPERVPFRLTNNMIDALGMTGVEGTFRHSAEQTMKILRNDSQLLLSVLHTFLYDPLVEWKSEPISTSISSSISSDGTAALPNATTTMRIAASEKLNEIDLRLRGYSVKETLPLSVHGQVDQLIREATSPNNLAQMYIGWMPWL